MQPVRADQIFHILFNSILCIFVEHPQSNSIYLHHYVISASYLYTPHVQTISICPKLSSTDWLAAIPRTLQISFFWQSKVNPHGKRITSKLSFLCYLLFMFDTFINRLQHPSSFSLLTCMFLLFNFPVMFSLSLQNKK